MKILIDTRERHPWSFSKYEWPDGCKTIALKTGDYTLEGLENVFTIDKKWKVTELAANLLQDRFKRELDRMSSLRYSYILCDFPISELEAYPRVEALPGFLWKKIRAKGPFLMTVLEKLKLEYPTEWIFTKTGRGRKMALEIIKDMATYNVE